MGAGHNAQRVGALGVPSLAGPQLILQVDHRAAVERERLPVVMPARGGSSAQGAETTHHLLFPVFRIEVKWLYNSGNCTCVLTTECLTEISKTKAMAIDPA